MMKSSRQKRILFIGALAYFLVMTLVFTRPLISRLTTHTAGGYGDNVYFIWQIEWIKRAIFELKTLPTSSHLLNFPYGYSLLTTETAPLQILLALPFALAGEAVLGFNLSMMSTFILAGMTMFCWIYLLTESPWAAIISGTAFAFLPYHAAHFLVGHLNLSGIQWFPLYFWGLTSILTSEDFSWKRVALFTTGLGAIAFTSLYYIYMTLVISALILIIYFVFFARKKALSKTIWKQLLIAGGMSLPFLFLGVGPYIYFHGSKGSTRVLEDAMQFSASVTDFILPFTKQALFGKWVWENFPRDLWNEATLYLGIAASALAIFAWLKRDAKQKDLLRLFLIGGISAAILAMGTNLNWMEKPVWIKLPHWLAAATGKDKSLIFLPGYLLFKYMPFYSLMRVSMRYGIITMVFTCAAAGLGTHWLINTVKSNRKYSIGIILLLLVVLDFYNTPFSTTAIKPRKVDLWLADQPEGGLVQLPYALSMKEEHIYYTLHHNKPLLGAIRAFPSDRFLSLGSVLGSFPDQASVDILRDEGITYIVVDETELPLTNDSIGKAEELGLNFHGSFAGQSVFTLAN